MTAVVAAAAALKTPAPIVAEPLASHAILSVDPTSEHGAPEEKRVDTPHDDPAAGACDGVPVESARAGAAASSTIQATLPRWQGADRGGTPGEHALQNAQRRRCVDRPAHPRGLERQSAFPRKAGTMGSTPHCIAAPAPQTATFGRCPQGVTRAGTFQQPLLQTTLQASGRLLQHCCSTSSALTPRGSERVVWLFP